MRNILPQLEPKEREAVEKEKLVTALSERVKELKCLYALADLVERPGVSLEGILQGLAEIIPPALRYPKIVCTRVAFEEKQFKTKNFKRTAWRQETKIKVHGKVVGGIEACYLEKRPGFGERTFLKEERDLINALAERTGKIIERREMASALLHAAEEWRTTFDSISDMISLNDKNYKIVRSNKAFANAFKMKPQEVIGKTCYKLIHGTNKPWPICPHKKALATRKPVRTEFFEPRLGVHLEVTASPVFDKKGRVIGSVHIVKNITERKKAEEALRESERKLRSVIENTNDVIFQLSPLGIIQFVNPKVEEYYGYKPKELIGKHLKKTTPVNELPRALEALKRILSGEEVRNFEIAQVNNKGKIIDMEINGTPIRKEGKVIAIQGIMRDITERKKAEEELRKAYDELKESQAQLIQSEKLAAIGQLATGAAHEINNPLFAISGEVEMLRKDKAGDKDIVGATTIVLEQCERIKNTVEKLLEFSHKREFKLAPLDINKVLKKSLTLLGYQAKVENVEIIEKLKPGPIKVLGGESQLEQAFLNIMLNAVQAMEKGGKLTVRTLSDTSKQGRKIAVVEFKDTGKGMNKQILQKIFNPFFSTREKGTGLGLSIAHRIIEEHAGVIEVDSKIGEGSTFIVKLPVFTGGGK